jgi:cytochrome P450
MEALAAAETLRTPAFPQFPQRRFIFERSADPLWTRLPRAEEARAYEVPEGLVLVQSEDIKAMLREPRFVQWRLWALERDPAIDRGFIERRKQQLLSMEGPDHLRLRKLCAPALSERAMAAYRPHMREVMRHAVDRVLDAGECEAVAALCRPYPIPVICGILGIPDDEADFFAEVAEAWQSWLLGGAAAVPRSKQAHDAIVDYLAPLIEKRRGVPGGDDMLSLLIHAEEQGDRLTREEVGRMIAGFLIGGIKTIRQGLANALYFFSRYPGQWERLVAEPALVRNAVEETLRLLPPVTLVTRVAEEAVDINGIHIPAHTRVFASIMSVNHDSRLFPDPGRFDIGRPPGPHLAFGHGRHVCVGTHLARAEMQEGLLVLARAMTGIEQAGELAWQPPETFQGPSRLPIRFRARR